MALRTLALCLGSIESHWLWNVTFAMFLCLALSFPICKIQRTGVDEFVKEKVEQDLRMGALRPELPALAS